MIVCNNWMQYEPKIYLKKEVPMVDYQKMYTIMFNGVTDALDMIRQERIREARYLLKQAQQRAEEIYIKTSDRERT